MILYDQGKGINPQYGKVVFYMMYTTTELITMVNGLLDEVCQTIGLEHETTIEFATLCENFINNIDSKNEIDLCEIFIAHHMAKVRYAEGINEE